eukprot:RCo045165
MCYAAVFFLCSSSTSSPPSTSTLLPRGLTDPSPEDGSWGGGREVGGCSVLVGCWLDPWAAELWDSLVAVVLLCVWGGFRKLPTENFCCYEGPSVLGCFAHRLWIVCPPPTRQISTTPNPSGFALFLISSIARSTESVNETLCGCRFDSLVKKKKIGRAS